MNLFYFSNSSRVSNLKNVVSFELKIYFNSNLERFTYILLIYLISNITRINADTFYVSFTKDFKILLVSLRDSSVVTISINLLEN